MFGHLCGELFARSHYITFNYPTINKNVKVVINLQPVKVVKLLAMTDYWLIISFLFLKSFSCSSGIPLEPLVERTANASRTMSEIDDTCIKRGEQKEGNRKRVWELG